MLLQRVFVDANVLVSRTQRDWLFQLRLHTEGMFQVHTTEDVLAEALSSLRNLKRDMPGGRVTNLARALRANLDELVDEFDTSIPYAGADPDDLHVHAAAVACKADILLTGDKGFAPSDDDPYEVYTCDEFFNLVDDSAPWMVQRTVHSVNQYWATQPAGRRKSIVRALEDADCLEFAGRVNQHLRALSGARR